MARTLLTAVGIGIGLLIAAAIMAFFALAASGPETSIVSGPQVKRAYIEQMGRLGMIEEGEQLRLFYSDALYNIEEGFYIITDRKIGIYSKAYSEPKIKLPFEDIEDYEVQFNDSFWNDSELTLFDRRGDSYLIPLSSEGGGDRRFAELLRGELVKRGNTTAGQTPPDAEKEADAGETPDAGQDATQ